MTDEQTLDQLVQDVVPADGGGFRPYAMFDGPMDCIRVLRRDCSVTEIRVNEILTVAQATYPTSRNRGEYVGFTVKGAKHFCHVNGLDEGASVRLSDVLDKILSKFPEPAVRFAIDCIARPLVESDPDIDTVSLEDPVAEPA